MHLNSSSVVGSESEQRQARHIFVGATLSATVMFRRCRFLIAFVMAGFTLCDGWL